MDKYDASGKTQRMSSYRMVPRAATTAIVVALLGLGCTSSDANGGVGSSGGSSSESAAPKGGQTSTSKTATSSSSGDSSQTDGGSSAENSSSGDTSNPSKGGARAGGSTGRGGITSGGQSESGEAGGTQSDGSAKGGTTSKSGSSTIGGTQARGGGSASSGASSGGTKAAGGGSSSVATPSGGGTQSSSSSSTKTPTYGGGGATSLCQKYADYFPIGAAVDSQSYNTHAALLTKHFNSITMENEMKFDQLQATEGKFTYGTADSIVAFATKNDMKVRGHALVWHRQVPSWVFANASRAVVLEKMKSHIDNVMAHYKGKVYAWDVVNEAIMDNGAFRTGNEANAEQSSQWHKTLGESYIAEAFKYAAAADPSAKLFYNDYYNYVPARRQAIYNLLKGLLDDGVKVDGVGLQAHFNIEPSTVTTNQAYHQTVAELEEAIKLYSSLGLEVQITEMDLSVYIPGVTYDSSTFYTAATFTDAVQAKQAERYREFFDLYRRYKDVITGVTLWGIADDNTWLSEFSSGRKDFPLLFDTNKKEKKAYYAVVDF